MRWRISFSDCKHATAGCPSVEIEGEGFPAAGIQKREVQLAGMGDVPV